MSESLAYNDDVAAATEGLYDTLRAQYQPAQWRALAPYIVEINRLKR